MAASSIRLWFALGVAIVAASIADPLVEAASNAGWFGAGNFSDHSNLDVAPAFALGALLVALYLALRVRALLTARETAAPSLARATGNALGRGALRLLPQTFVLQLGALFAMETTEQLVVWGHPLGPAIWLGGPIAFSLAAHAIACAVVLSSAALCVRALAVRTARVLSALYALATSRKHVAAPMLVERLRDAAFLGSWPVLCRIGERAPPVLQKA